MKEHMHEHMHQHKGIMLTVIGLIVLANELYFRFSWWLVLGVLLVLKGVILLVLKNYCEHKKE